MEPFSNEFNLIQITLLHQSILTTNFYSKDCTVSRDFSVQKALHFISLLLDSALYETKALIRLIQ